MNWLALDGLPEFPFDPVRAVVNEGYGDHSCRHFVAAWPRKPGDSDWARVAVVGSMSQEILNGYATSQAQNAMCVAANCDLYLIEL